MSQQTEKAAVHCLQCGALLKNPKPGQKTVTCPGCGATYVVHGAGAGWLRRQWELMQYRRRKKAEQKLPKAVSSTQEVTVPKKIRFSEKVRAQKKSLIPGAVILIGTLAAAAAVFGPFHAVTGKPASPSDPKTAAAARPFSAANSRKWKKLQTSGRLPEPPLPIEQVIFDREDELAVHFSPVEKGEMMDYLHACEAMGYRRENMGQSWYPRFFSEKGWALELRYFESMQKLHLKLEAPRPMGELTWPATDLPKPPCKLSHTAYSSDRGFHIYVSPMDHDQWSQYVDQVMALGYVRELSRYSNSFSALGGNGEEVDIEYLGNQEVEIRQRHPSEEK